MNRHLTEDEMIALAAGPPAGGDAARAHLAECARCRRELERERTLAARAAGLPRELQPEADLWPAIRSRIAAHEAGRTAGRRERWWGYGLAAAVILLLLVPAGLWLARTGAAPGLPAANGPVAVVPGGPGQATAFAAYQPAEAELAGTVDALLAEFDARRHALDPETVAVVEENLRIIEEALRATRAALDADPNSRELTYLATATYARKIELLEQAIRLASRT